MNNRCALEIGGIRVLVTVTPPGFIERVVDRYQGFLSENLQEPDLALDLQLSPPSLISPLQLTPLFSQNKITFDEFGFTGSISPKEKKAVLSLASPTPDHDFDYFLRVVYALLVYHRGGLLFHGAGVVHKGRSCIFFGPSGIGKTTTARLSAPRTILNDDLLILLPKTNGWTAFGTPFWNPSQVRPAPTSAPLAAMFRLQQSGQNSIQSIPPAQILAELIAGVPVLSTDPSYGLDLLNICQKIAGEIPIASLMFRKDPSLWQSVEKFLVENTTGTI